MPQNITNTGECCAASNSCVPHVLDWLDGGLDMGMSHGGVWCACQPFSDGPPNSPYSDLNSLYPYSYPNSPYP